VLLVVFGAGASYDSDPDHPPAFGLNVRADTLPSLEHDRPPLANRLFDNSLSSCQRWRHFQSADHYTQLRKADIAVEQELARLQAKPMPTLNDTQLAAIRFTFATAVGMPKSLAWHS